MCEILKTPGSNLKLAKKLIFIKIEIRLFGLIFLTYSLQMVLELESGARAGTQTQIAKSPGTKANTKAQNTGNAYPRARAGA